MITNLQAQTLTDEYILKKCREVGALLDGHFLLRSKLHSGQYFQCALLLQYPDLAESFCRALAVKFQSLQATTVISPALGGVLVGQEVGRALGLRHIFVEKNTQGNLELRRNFTINEGERLLLIEDVITKGGRVRETIDLMQNRGARVVAVGTLVDRSCGSVDFGIPLKYLLQLSIESYEAFNCPMCKQSVPLTKPGS